MEQISEEKRGGPHDPQKAPMVGVTTSVINASSTVFADGTGSQLTESLLVPGTEELFTEKVNLVDTTISELPSLDEVSKQMYKVAVVDWTTLQTTGDIIATYDLGSWNSHPTFLRMDNIGGYSFKNLKFRVETAPGFNMNGVLGISLIPATYSTFTATWTDRASKLGQNMAKIMPIPATDAVEVLAPYAYPYDFVSHRATQSGGGGAPLMWKFIIYVISPLKYGTGGNTLKLNVFLGFDGLKVHTFTADTLPTKSISEVKRTVREVGTTVGRALWPSSLWDLVDKVGPMMGFSNPSVDPTQLNSSYNYSCAGNRPVQHLGDLLDEDTVPNRKGYDALDFEAMATVPQQIFEVTLPLDTAAGVQLNTLLHPFKNSKAALGNISSSNMVAGVIAEMFMGWACDFRLHIVVAKSMQDCRFRVTWVPLKLIAGAITDSDQTYTLSKDFSVKQGVGEACIFNFDIPYCSAGPYLKSKDVDESAATDTSVMSNGFVKIETLTPVRGPDTCSDLNLVVFLSCHNLRCNGWRGGGIPYPASADSLANPNYPITDGRNHPLNLVDTFHSFGKMGVVPTVDVETNAGYPITSFRQVMHKAVWGVSVPNTSVLNPWRFEMASGAGLSRNAPNSVLHIIRGMHSYESGSMDVFVKSDGPILVNQEEHVSTTVDSLLETARTGGTSTDTLWGSNTALQAWPSNVPLNEVTNLWTRMRRYMFANFTTLVPSAYSSSVSSSLTDQPVGRAKILTYNTTGVLNATSWAGVVPGEDYAVYYRRPMPTLYYGAAFT